MTASDAASQRAGGDLRNYAIVTGAYWADTIADGASRVLVLYYFHERGYSPLELATLFLLYEAFGMVTNLVGGWLGTRLGLRFTLLAGLGVQVVALGSLAVVPDTWLVVPVVMVAQALSGIAKDLTKTSSKSAVRLVAPAGQPGALYRWVSVLTGSKNALKGLGFFLGGLLLTVAGFQTAMFALAALVLAALVGVLLSMRGRLGRVDARAKFTQMLSHERAVNVLAGARLLLFASRDVWFVVGLPVFLRSELGWGFWQAGGFLALWIVGYGIVQASAPALTRRRGRPDPDGRSATGFAFCLAAIPAAMAIALATGLDPTGTVVGGLVLFGLAFALNSAVHSFLILDYARHDRVAMNVGFYYTANAAGRLVGTILSGALYQWQGLEACLWAASVLVLGAGVTSLGLPRRPPTGSERSAGAAAGAITGR